MLKNIKHYILLFSCDNIKCHWYSNAENELAMMYSADEIIFISFFCMKGSIWATDGNIFLSIFFLK